MLSRTATTLCSSSAVPTVLWSNRIAFPEKVLPGAISVHHGLIRSCLPRVNEAAARALASHMGAQFHSFGTNIVSPGLVDIHCHISELGREFEGYYTATRAAAAGGITTLMGMPLNSLPPTVSKTNFERETTAAKNTPLFADVGLWGGVIPDSLADLDELLDDSGIFGIKAFLAPLPESAGYQNVSPGILREVAIKCGKRNLPLLVHSELMSPKEEVEQQEVAYASHSIPFEAHVASRPAEWERRAIEVVCDLAHFCHMHIVHLSDAGSLALIVNTKKALKHRPKNPKLGGLTVETCPHYLLFDETNVSSSLHKCFPPIRNKVNQTRLRDAVINGSIDILASDHSPCLPTMRQGSLKDAWGGIAGLQYQLAASLTSLENAPDPITLLNDVWSQRPSQLIPSMNVGKIESGRAANLCVWDDSTPMKTTTKDRHRWTDQSPFSAMPLLGNIVATFLHGMLVYDGETDRLIEDFDATGRFRVR